ncbi:hypothetical protein ID866_10812 [Astraeus odoratus]|nr:hypothetical protein ID866_10812 [Astraeus odoratus]
MYSMPIHAVPKPGTGNFHLVTDHSAGQYTLNNMITRDDVSGVTLDNIHDLGNALHLYQHHNPTHSLILWKADVSEAYHLMPMHPLWQIKQIVSVGSQQWVDHCNVFGGHASQCIWHAFMSLVLWIVIFKLLIFAFLYVDDSFGFSQEGDLLWHEKYQKTLPQNMVKLLHLWDELGIPHEEHKQIYGPILPIIGFEVDPNLMQVQMSDESYEHLITFISEFAH